MADGAQALLARADRAFAGRRVGEAVEKVRAIIGVPRVPDSEAAAQAALDKLRANERPTAAELAALELVIRMMRPAPLSHRGRLDALPSRPGSTTYNPELAARWEGFRDKVEPFIYSIGRLDRASGGQDASAGTGFLVGEDLLLTNRHVLDALSFGAQALDEGQAVVGFYNEDGLADPVPPFPIVGVVAVHDTLDMALLRVRLPEPRRWLQAGADVPDVGAEVAAIGYPWPDRSNPLFAPAIFANKYGVKRAAVGEVMGVRDQRFFHDCSTLGGNSGSPVFELAHGRLVGLHYSGLFMYRNEAIPGAELTAFVEAA
jgi:S1-C subfamily serine protease